MTVPSITGAAGRPVRAVRVIPPLQPGQPVRHGLAYVVTLQDIPPVEDTLVIEMPLPKMIGFDPINDYPRGQLFQWCLGFDGKELVWRPISKLGHILIGGTTQYGKSSTWTINIVAMLLNHSPDLVKIVAIDPKGLNTAFLDNAPHLLMPVACDGEVTSATQVMARLAQEIQDRRNLMRGIGTSLEDYNSKVNESHRLPVIIGIWDEFAALAAVAGTPRAPMYRFLVQVINQGASLGVHMILTTQTPTAEVVDTVARTQCDTRIVMHCTEAGQFKATLGLHGYNGLMGKLDARGRALVRIAGEPMPKIVQMPYLPFEAISALCRWNGDGQPIPVADYPILTDRARRLVSWALEHPEEFNGGMSRNLLKRAFERQGGERAEDGGPPMSEWEIRSEVNTLAARGLLVRESGKYKITAQLAEMVESR